MIEIKNLTKTFPSADGTFYALKNVSLTINDGEIYGIIGMSGAGKSTLVRCINMLERPTEGEVLINGRNLCAMSEQELRAQELAAEMVTRLPKIAQKVQLDLEATFDGDPAAGSREEILFSYPGLFAILVYRVAHELYQMKVPILPRMMSEYAHSHTGIDIHPGAQIGDYFFIDHGTGIVVGETTVIGDRVKLYQGVTLGALSPRDGHHSRPGKRHPTVEDDVTIYSGASILGGETVIGRGSVVGGNAFLTGSVQEDTRVVIHAPETVFKHRNEERK